MAASSRFFITLISKSMEEKYNKDIFNQLIVRRERAKKLLESMFKSMIMTK